MDSLHQDPAAPSADDLSALADTVLQPGWGSGREWALGYLAMAVVFLLSRLSSRRLRSPS